MPRDQRGAWLASLHEEWTTQAAAEYKSWAAASDPEGRQYFYHVRTGESMWSHPAEAILPFHYLKIEAVKSSSTKSSCRSSARGRRRSSSRCPRRGAWTRHRPSRARHCRQRHRCRPGLHSFEKRLAGAPAGALAIKKSGGL